MPSETFRVIYPGQVQDTLRDILRKAEKTGKMTRFANAVFEMDRRLHENPLGLGELIGRLRSTNALRQIGFVRPLKIDFTIYEDEESCSC